MLKIAKKWPNFALGWQFWLQSDFFLASPPHLTSSPSGTKNFEVSPHQKFREKNPAGCHINLHHEFLGLLTDLIENVRIFLPGSPSSSPPLPQSIHKITYMFDVGVDIPGCHVNLLHEFLSLFTDLVQDAIVFMGLWCSLQKILRIYRNIIFQPINEHIHISGPESSSHRSKDGMQQSKSRIYAF